MKTGTCYGLFMNLWLADAMGLGVNLLVYIIVSSFSTQYHWCILHILMFIKATHLIMPLLL